MADPHNEYADIRVMLKDLQSLTPGSSEHRRLHEEIYRRTLPLARHIARRFRGRGQPHDDLMQVACLGLVNAINRFDPDAGSEFTAFAVPTVMGEVRRYFRDLGWAVKVPRRIKDLSIELTRARAELTQRNGRPPTSTELAEHLGVDREEVMQVLIANGSYSTMSLDHLRDSEDDYMALKETVGQLDSRLDKVVDSETIRPLIEQLPAREQMILKMRFFDDMTQTQIAERLGISQMHVSRILSKSLTTLRNQALDSAAAAETPGPHPTQAA